jgi:D-lactate dehydrogenase
VKQYDRDSFNEINKKYNFKLKYYETKLTLDSLPLTQGYDVVCVFVNDNITKELIDGLVENGVKMIALRCAGYNNVDFESAKDKIKIVRVPAYSPYAVAEHAVTLMMALNRKIHKAYLRTREVNFSLNGLTGFDMNNKTAGIVGTGKIAKILIKILRGFGMNVLAYDIYPDERAAKELGYRYVDLEELYRKADIISLHCPLTPETEYLINKESIEKMKHNVMIINTGRGKLIDTKELIEGLKSKKIGAAGLDVYEEESEYFFEDKSAMVLTDDILARLLTFSNVLITSHQAFLTKEALENIATTTLESIQEFVEGKELSNEIAYICNDMKCEIKDIK